MTTPDEYQKFRLTDSMHAWAVAVGEGRHYADVSVNDASHYTNKRYWKYSDIAGSTVPCLAELAVAAYLDEFWAGAVWEGSEIKTQERLYADVGTDVEVRHLTNRHFGIVVRRKDVEAGRSIVGVYANDADPARPNEFGGQWITTYDGFREWVILGVIDPAVGWEVGEWDKGKKFKRVAHEHLQPIDVIKRPTDEPVPPALPDDEARTVWHEMKTWEKRAVRLCALTRQRTGDQRTLAEITADTARGYIWGRVNNRLWVPSEDFITAATVLGDR